MSVELHPPVHLDKGVVVSSWAEGVDAALFAGDDELFDHIFLVADVNEMGQRISITNMTQIQPEWDCFIKEVVLYTPGDMVNEVINKEWNI
mgnify:CR=1 FL=1